MEISLIQKHFPSLEEQQIKQFEHLSQLYRDWNDKINVISRKDMDNLEERHLLHSLSISKFFTFRPGTRLLDLGTGGGLPGLPLAILWPEINFTLVDGTGKKIKVVQEMIEVLGLTNAIAVHSRAEDLKMKFDFVLARGVTTLDKLLFWTRKLVDRKSQNLFPNGLIAYKGGDPQQELKYLHKKDQFEIFVLKKKIQSPLLEDKYLVYVQA
jgi:16S rRNA (guanine527-N7)-methyltransferase